MLVVLLLLLVWLPLGLLEDAFIEEDAQVLALWLLLPLLILPLPLLLLFILLLFLATDAADVAAVVVVV